jgi:hypothetical protein
VLAKGTTPDAKKGIRGHAEEKQPMMLRPWDQKTGMRRKWDGRARGPTPETHRGIGTARWLLPKRPKAQRQHRIPGALRKNVCSILACSDISASRHHPIPSRLHCPTPHIRTPTRLAKHSGDFLHLRARPTPYRAVPLPAKAPWSSNKV